MLSEVNAHVAELRPQILQVALQVLDGVDVAVVADRSLEAMDENQDGKVTRDEFLSLFISVMTEVRACWAARTCVCRNCPADTRVPAARARHVRLVHTARPTRLLLWLMQCAVRRPRSWCGRGSRACVDAQCGRGGPTPCSHTL